MDLSAGSIKAALGGAMTARGLAKICAAQAIIIIVLGTVFYCTYKRQAARLVEADAFSSMQQLVIDKAKANISARQVMLEAERKQWAAERQQIKSAAAAVKIITKYVPGTEGQTVIIPAAQISSPELFQPVPGTGTPQGAPAGETRQQEAQAQPPAVPGAIAPEAKQGNFVLQTEQAAIKTASAVQEGQQCKRELEGCRLDTKDFRAQVQALELDRNKWRNTAKGGSTAKRILRGFAIGACGAGGAAIGAEKGNKGAAIGSLIGAAGCAFLTK